MVTRKEKLTDKIQQLQAQLKNLDKQDKQQQRKTETKKKILLGALLQQWIKMGQIQEGDVLKGLDKLLVRESERSLFSLAPLPSPIIAPTGQPIEGQQQPEPTTEVAVAPTPSQNAATVALEATKITASSIPAPAPQKYQAKQSTKPPARLPEVDERKLEDEFL
jgi:hypothetical protein